ncbi:hypothetical protein LEP1GSC050_1811 [Leptospira broomii serovar Hurstbridge str. 5399]|uniref:Uncharacterized protein n=1 Tax=Leptospira broomii serovar Hurstbridge str. 5399 TaxID=1049789 RepID=T0FH99_9LEPT|nr:hypothetical protein LEP1GSC050_1811 [Leptospira broomii serovar Hurstbridge str. 5399]
MELNFINESSRSDPKRINPIGVFAIKVRSGNFAPLFRIKYDDYSLDCLVDI